MKTTFYQIVAEFTDWLIYMDSAVQGMWKHGPNDTTLKFFHFLESKYPKIWERLNRFYADDESHDDEEFNKDCSRIALYGWQEIAVPGKFDEFLQGFKDRFLWLSDQDHGVCPFCNEEKDLAIEHCLIASYDFGPLVKFNKNYEMDGSRDWEQPICRNCAVQMYKKIQDQVNEDEVQCWV